MPSLPEVHEPLRGTRVATLTACCAGPANRGAALLGELTARAPAPVLNACRPLTAADLGNLSNNPGTPMPARMRGELLSDPPDEASGRDQHATSAALGPWSTRMTLPACGAAGSACSPTRAYKRLVAAPVRELQGRYRVRDYDRTGPGADHQAAWAEERNHASVRMDTVFDYSERKRLTATAITLRQGEAVAWCQPAWPR